MTSIVASSEPGPTEPAPPTAGAERASGDRWTSRLTQRFGLPLAVAAGGGLLLRLGYVDLRAQGALLHRKERDALASVPYFEWHENSLRFPDSPVAEDHGVTYGDNCPAL